MKPSSISGCSPRSRSASASSRLDSAIRSRWRAVSGSRESTSLATVSRAMSRVSSSFPGLFPDPLGQVLVQASGLDQVADPEQHLAGVERLGEEVPGAPGQRLALDLRIGVGRDHQDGEVVLARDRGADRVQHLDAAHPRHVEIEDDQVRPHLPERVEGPARVDLSPDVPVSRRPENGRDQPDLEIEIVDDEDPRVRKRRAGKDVVPAREAGRGDGSWAELRRLGLDGGWGPAGLLSHRPPL